jgi:uncharacterized protein YbjQ (UPF0145 family)
MMEMHGHVKGTVCNGVFFTEASVPTVPTIRHLQVRISRQNANLTDVKERLAAQAKALGASAIVNFRYGQRKHEWWELVFTFKWDTESWHGEGDAVTEIPAG